MYTTALLMTLVVLALRVASAPTAAFCLLPLSIYAMFGRRQTIHALFLSWLLTQTNLGFAPDLGFGWGFRFVVIGAAAISILVRDLFVDRRVGALQMTLATLALGGYFIAHSLMVSPQPSLSIAKALVWVSAMTSSLSAWSALSETQRSQLQNIITWSLVAILFVSLPLASTGVGYRENGHGFQGITNHPQSFGMTMSVLGALIGGRLLGSKRTSVVQSILFLLVIVGIFMSEARTAALGLIFGLSVSIVFVPILSGKSLRSVAPAIADRRMWLIAALGLLLLAPFSLKLMNASIEFLRKGTNVRSVSLFEAYSTARGSLLEGMYSNIRRHPLFGIGFGIASDPDSMVVSREPFFDLPIAATVEKGVAPVAVVEETGVVGGVFVGFWLFGLLHAAARAGIGQFAMIATVLTMNMGEFVLFSPGGAGLLFMVMMGWSCAEPKPNGVAQGSIG